MLNSGVNLYRKTVKRVRPAHVALHGLVTHGAVPLLERTSGLRTMPDDPLWFRLELLLNRHETETLSQVRGLVKPGMTALDIGAHVGYYARRLSRLVGPRGRVLAFEPHPRTFATLQHNLRRFANVTPVQAALAETAGTAALYDYLIMSASGSLHYDESLAELQRAQVESDDIAPRISEGFQTHTYQVQTLAVDDYLAEQGITAVDFVKMDIEGAEIGALRGMQRTIAASSGLCLVMEYNPQALRAFGHDPQGALDEVMSMGFARMRVIEADGGLRDVSSNTPALSTMTETLMQHMGVVNLLFTKL